MTRKAARLEPGLRRHASRLGQLRLGPIALSIAGVALMVRLPLLFAPVEQHADTPLYLAIARKLSFADDPAQFNTLRTPGYPLFVAPLRIFPWRWEDAIGISQHLLGIALAPAVAWAGWRYLGRIAAVLAGLAVALSPMMVTVESLLTPDLLLAVLLLAGACVLAEAVRRDQPDVRALVATGAIFALAAYVKPGALPLALAAVLPLAVATRSWRATLRGSLILAFTMAALVLPWFVRNWATHETFTMSTVGDVSIFARAFDQDGLPISTETSEGVLVKREHERVLRDVPVRPLNTEWLVHSRLLRRGYSHEEIAAIQGRLARKAIRAHPGTYTSGTTGNLVESIRMARHTNLDFILDRSDRSKLGFPLSADSRLWQLGNLYTKGLWLLSLSALLAIVLAFAGERRQRAAAAAFGSVLLLITLTNAATYEPKTRYTGEVAPLLWLLESAAAVLVISAIARWIYSRRRYAPRGG